MWLYLFSVGSTVVVMHITTFYSGTVTTLKDFSSCYITSIVTTMTLTTIMPLSVWRAAFCVQFFSCDMLAYQGPKSIEDFHHNTGTAFYSNGVFTTGLENSKMFTQVSCMKMEPDPLHDHNWQHWQLCVVLLNTPVTIVE